MTSEDCHNRETPAKPDKVVEFVELALILFLYRQWVCGLTETSFVNFLSPNPRLLLHSYLINHKLKTHLDNDNVTGLYADIECPTVSLSVMTNSVANEMPPVRLRPSSKATKAIS